MRERERERERERKKKEKLYSVYSFSSRTKHVFPRIFAARTQHEILSIKLNDVDRKLIARKILCQLKSTFSETFREIETYFWFIRGPFPAESMLNRFRGGSATRCRPPTRGFRNGLKQNKTFRIERDKFVIRIGRRLHISRGKRPAIILSFVATAFVTVGRGIAE